MKTNKSDQQVLPAECLNTVYGAMVVALLYHKKFNRLILKGDQREYGDALPSSKMRYTHFEACEYRFVANKTVNGK